MTENILKRETESYWAYTQCESSIDKVICRYIGEGIDDLNGKSLLEAEIAYARNKNNIEVETCDTLVLLVGLSLEPLLQSICVYKPQKIILALNEDGYPVPAKGARYDTEEPSVFAKHMEIAVNTLAAAAKILDVKPKIDCSPTKDNEVFKTLVKALHEEANVVIDITGGKKSMVTSAFLYAAFSGARISYVDFDLYSVNNRRPWGYSCKIGELDNPYQDFSLREWEKIRVLYNKYQFNEAFQLLTDIKAPMIKQLPESKEPIENLIKFIKFYDQWNIGDFRSAKRAADRLQEEIGKCKFRLPSAVEILGDHWYEFNDDTILHTPDPIYGNLAKLTVYVCNEMARIERLINYNEDYRSAFLRAGGVSEIIMLGRLLDLVENKVENEVDAKMDLLNKLKERTPDAIMVLNAFLNKKEITIGYKGDIEFYGYRKKNDPKIVVTNETLMDPWWQKTDMFKDENNKKGYEIFLDKRNEAAHKYFPVPRRWAEEGFKFVMANFEDFLDQVKDDPVVNCGTCALRRSEHLSQPHFLQPIHMNCCTYALPWSELCKLCKVDCFLTPNLRRDE